MFFRIDHIAIAVKHYRKALDFFQGIFGAVPGTSAEDPHMNYFWQNLSLGDLSRLELLTPTGDGGLLDGFLQNRDGGVHHITLHTGDVRKAKETLDKNGTPYFGYTEYGDMWKELFIHPRDAFGVLVQIAQFRPDDWIAEPEKLSKGKKWRLTKTENGCTASFAHPGGGKCDITLTADEVEALIDDLKKSIKQLPEQR